jgi:predicted regulator of Ras-like GTPase activity (Roadblock/LC7/MglB family)
MAVRGDLTDLDLLSLLQITCEEGSDAQIEVQRGREEALLYVYQGQIVHAEAGRLIGQEAVYHVLAWENGSFTLERNRFTSPPRISIEIDWNNLLLEGLRRLDEEQDEDEPTAAPDEGAYDYNHDERQDNSMAIKTRSEAINETLESILSESFDIQGAMVVSRDGLVMSSRLPSGLEDARVGAVSAGVLSLGVRSITQLGRGDFNQILAQGSKGNVVVTGAGSKAAFVALTAANVNLGMVFLEAREAAERIAHILD